MFSIRQLPAGVTSNSTHFLSAFCGPGTMLGAVQQCPIRSSPEPWEIYTIIIPTLQMSKLMHRAVRLLFQRPNLVEARFKLETNTGRLVAKPIARAAPNCPKRLFKLGLLRRGLTPIQRKGDLFGLLRPRALGVEFSDLGTRLPERH